MIKHYLPKPFLAAIRIAFLAAFLFTAFTSNSLWAQAEDCCTDGNKIAAMTITYTGEDCSATSHNQNPDKVTCNGDPAGKQTVHIIVNNKQNPDEGNLFFEGDVQLGTPFTVEAATAGKDEFKAETWFHIFDDQWNLLQEVRFHTSCSQPIAAGNQFGSIHIDNVVLTNGDQCGETPPECNPCDDGGLIADDEAFCGPFDPEIITEVEAPDCDNTPPPPPADCCADGNKIAQLTMTYTGEDCSATSHSQDPDKVSCDGDPLYATTVHIVASEKKGGDGKVWFEGDVNLGEQFTLDASNANESRLKSNTWVDIYSPSGQ
ncbi:MAG: hypothetical protein D6816_18905, partial [Bacteroidetes bacterium]